MAEAWCAGKLHDEPRRTRFDSFALAREAEVNFGRGGEQAARHGGGDIPVELRGGVRHGGIALDSEREQRMRGAGGGPGFFAGAEKPDGIGSKASGFGGACDQYGCVLRFGREERFGDGAIEGSEEILPPDAAAIEAE